MSDNATVIAREEVSPGNIILRIRPDDGVPDFEAGQFVVLGLMPEIPRVVYASTSDEDDTPPKPGKMIRRAYSIASADQEKEYLEFFITLVRSGQLTPRLFGLEVGDRVFVTKKPTGIFTLDSVPEEADALFVSTGTGLAPHMSILRSRLTCGGERKFAIVHGARVSWDLGYRAELESLNRLCPNFLYLPAITRPEEDPNFSGPAGRLQQLIDNGFLERNEVAMDPESTHVFLCGNPQMIEAVQEVLVTKGFTPDERGKAGNVHAETYW